MNLNRKKTQREIVLVVAFFFVGTLLIATVALPTAGISFASTSTTSTINSSPSSSGSSSSTARQNSLAQVNQMSATQKLVTQNLTPDEQIVDGQRYTPRWSAPIWVNGSSLNVLIVPCAAGEFALSDTYILASPDLSITETYPVALPDTSMIWLAVVQNEASTRQLASLGVICAGDSGQAPASTVIDSDSFDRTVNNILQQFIVVQNGHVVNIGKIINVFQTINQVAIQIAINNTGNVTQIINQTAGQIIQGNGTNIPQIIANSTGQQPGATQGITTTPTTNRTDITVPGSQFPGTQGQEGPEALTNDTGATETTVRRLGEPTTDDQTQGAAGETERLPAETGEADASETDNQGEAGTEQTGDTADTDTNDGETDTTGTDADSNDGGGETQETGGGT